MKNLIMALAVVLGSWSTNSFAWEWIPRPDESFEANKVRLGETFLMNRNDSDFIAVEGGQVCGLSAFKIAIRGDDARIRDLKVLFGNGQMQDIPVRLNFARGTDSRWVDLAGDTRCIKGIYVNGKSRTRTPRETRVVFFGVKRDYRDPDFRAVKLGQTSLMNRSDADFIDLRGSNCGMRSFKISVLGDDARIDYLMIQFRNGESQQINVREVFRAGTSSNWKDIDGNRRCIDKVFVYGRSSNIRLRPSIVEFWGRY